MKRATTLKPPQNTVAGEVDPDNPPWHEEMLGPPVVRRGRGPQRSPTKVSTTIRIDAEVLDYFRSTGAGYQTRMNDILRAAKARATAKTASARGSRRGVKAIRRAKAVG
jgi:uncharacterized protein (DUF4415 family)